MFKANHNPDLMIVNLLLPLRHLLGANVSSASTSQLRLQNLFSRIVIDCILALLFVLTHPKKKTLLRESSCVCVFFFFFEDICKTSLAVGR